MNVWKELAFSGGGKASTTALYVFEIIFRDQRRASFSEIGTTSAEFRHSSAQHSNANFSLRAYYLPASAFVAVHLQVRSAWRPEGPCLLAYLLAFSCVGT